MLAGSLAGVVAASSCSLRRSPLDMDASWCPKVSQLVVQVGLLQYHGCHFGVAVSNHHGLP